MSLLSPLRCVSCVQGYSDPVLGAYVVLTATSFVFSLTCVIVLTIMGLQIDLCINKVSNLSSCMTQAACGPVLPQLRAPALAAPVTCVLPRQLACMLPSSWPEACCAPSFSQT